MSGCLTVGVQQVMRHRVEYAEQRELPMLSVAMCGRACTADCVRCTQQMVYLTIAF